MKYDVIITTKLEKKRLNDENIKNNTCYYNLQMNTLHKKANCDNENIKEG